MLFFTDKFIFRLGIFRASKNMRGVHRMEKRYFALVLIVTFIASHTGALHATGSTYAENIPVHTRLTEGLVFQPGNGSSMIVVGDKYTVDFNAVLANSTHYKLQLTMAKVEVKGDWMKIFHEAIHDHGVIEKYIREAYDDTENYPVNWDGYLPRLQYLAGKVDNGETLLGAPTADGNPYLMGLLYFTPLALAYKTMETTANGEYQFPASVYVGYSVLAYGDPYLFDDYMYEIQHYYKADFQGFQVYRGVPVEVYQFKRQTESNSITWRVATLSPGGMFGFIPISYNASSMFRDTESGDKITVYMKGYSDLDLKAFLGNPDIAVYKVQPGMGEPIYLTVYSWGSSFTLDYVKSNKTISLVFDGDNPTVLLGLITVGGNKGAFGLGEYKLYPRSATFGSSETQLNNGEILLKGLSVKGVHRIIIPIQFQGKASIKKLDLSKNTLDIQRLASASNPSYINLLQETSSGGNRAQGQAQSTSTTSSPGLSGSSSTGNSESEGSSSSGGTGSKAIITLAIIVLIGYWIYKSRL